jgi:hypothetical protein
MSNSWIFVIASIVLAIPAVSRSSSPVTITGSRVSDTNQGLRSRGLTRGSIGYREAFLGGVLPG